MANCRLVNSIAVSAIFLTTFLVFCPIDGFAADSLIEGVDGDIGLMLYATGLTYPVGIANANDGTNRLFVVEQRGKIKIIEDGVVRPTPFLNISKLLPEGEFIATHYETGLLSMVFHPQYSSNGIFFIWYTDTENRIRLAKYHVSDNDPNVADRDSRQIILTIPHPDEYNHYGGGMCFGNDGYLYIGSSDGGGVGDPHGNGQDKGTLKGKILRIDVDNQSGHRKYAIPSDNPFVGHSGKDEIFAYGFRNPWRIFCDNVDDRLFVGDVGQYLREEIDMLELPDDAGKNYGWNVMEGSVCFDRTKPLTPKVSCNEHGKELPIREYNRLEFGAFKYTTTAVILGGMYRGTITAIQDRLIYADFQNGIIDRMHENDDGSWSHHRIFNHLLTNHGLVMTSFGFDESGELYLTDYHKKGHIYKFVELN